METPADNTFYWVFGGIVGTAALLTGGYFLFFYKKDEKKIIKQATALAKEVSPGTTVKASDFFEDDELKDLAAHKLGMA